MEQIFLTKEDMLLHIAFLNFSINEVIEVLTGIRTFINTSIFDTKCVQVVTMNELKKSVPGN